MIQDAGWAGGQLAWVDRDSLDLRDRVARFVVSGGACREAAERFCVGVATAVRWSQRLRSEGSPAARRIGAPAEWRAVMA